jgi:hypothetical protein
MRARGIDVAELHRQHERIVLDQFKRAWGLLSDANKAAFIAWSGIWQGSGPETAGRPADGA